jgi:4'-phosphopantetheinyl transferase
MQTGRRTVFTGLRAGLTGLRAGLTGLRGGLTRLDEVDAWLIDLDAPVDPAAASLLTCSPLARTERDRATTYLRPRDSARFAASRAWLRLLLGRYLDTEPADLSFMTGPDRRPVLAGDHAGSLHFSLSRSAGLALIAVSRSPVGADIELVSARAGLADLIGDRFGAAEAGCIARGCGGSPLHGFYRHWTAKEAYLKATGRGLAGLRGTELVCGVRPLIQYDGRLATNWTLSLPELAVGCAAAVIGDGPVTHYRAVR